MPYQIDQSIKIEDTRRTSFVCIANSKTCTCSISAKEKRILELYFKKLKKILIFKLFTFSVLCAKVFFKTKIQHVVIDNEYPGHAREIKSFIVQILTIYRAKTPQIYFSRIGKNSNAHLKVYHAYKKNKSDMIINSADVLYLYNKVNKA